MEFSVNIFARFFKLVHALPQASGQIWQLLRAEKNKHDKKDDKYVRATEVSKAKCEYIHNSIDSAGPLIIPRKLLMTLIPALEQLFIRDLFRRGQRGGEED